MRVGGNGGKSRGNLSQSSGAPKRSNLRFGRPSNIQYRGGEAFSKKEKSKRGEKGFFSKIFKKVA